MKRLQHVVARKHVIIISVLSAALLALVVVLAVTLSNNQRTAHSKRSAAAELLMARPGTAATPLAAENAAVRIDKLQQHVENESSNDLEKQKAAAALIATAEQSGWSLKQYYTQLLNKKLLPTVQEQCQGFILPEKQQLPPLQPKTDKKPNFIYLLIDDMGYDDLRMHHPPTGGMHNWVKTPHLDKIVQQGLEFTNFYTTPMCSTSRAELLTGRYYPRTGSMYVNSGWDFMNFNETHMGEIFSAAGYRTAHFGKWHNGRTAGYMPSDAGFDDTYEPTPYVHYENVFTINGKNIQTKGWMEDRLMDDAIQYLTQREADNKPFLLYYPTFSVHAGWMTMDHAGPRYQRPAPPKYLDKFLAMPLSQDTAHLYAMLEHIDEQIGRLMEWLDQSGLAENTYVFLGGDNGPALFGSEQRPVPKEVRMPSGMQGSKHEVEEGGIRNFLAVRGPGVPQGTSTDVLTALVDVIPTLVDMAGIQQVISHAPWDGVSFANIIRAQPPTLQQQERMYITMETQCTEDDFVPLLGPDRHVLKPQPLLDYTTGGVGGLGFKRCIGVRYKNYKWLADGSETKGRGAMYRVGGDEVPSGLYKFHETSHVELGCQEVSKTNPAMASKLEAAAAAWWQDMLHSAHSFERVTFFLGLGNKPVANVVTDGAVQRTPGRVQVVPMGLSGFEQSGDAAWYRIKVATAGTYDVTLYHQSSHKAKFRIWVGSHDAIKAGTAMHLDATLDATAGRTAVKLGSLKLPQTPAGHTWEIKVEMIGNSVPGKPAVVAVDVIVFRLQGMSGEDTPVYQPDLQEGVKAWKIKKGYAHIQSMEPVATINQDKQHAVVVKEVESPQDTAAADTQLQGDR